MEAKIFPYRKINGINKLGSIIRQKRKHDKLTQAELAKLSGVGNRFISELENGKPTLEVAKVLQVIATLKLELHMYQSLTSSLLQNRQVEISE